MNGGQCAVTNGGCAFCGRTKQPVVKTKTVKPAKPTKPAKKLVKKPTNGKKESKK